MLRTHIDTQQ